MCIIFFFHFFSFLPSYRPDAHQIFLRFQVLLKSSQALDAAEAKTSKAFASATTTDLVGMRLKDVPIVANSLFFRGETTQTRKIFGLRWVIFQRGEYMKPRGFDGWFFKGGSTQNQWGLMGDFSKGGVHETEEFWWVVFQRGEYIKPMGFDGWFFLLRVTEKRKRLCTDMTCHALIM